MAVAVVLWSIQTENSEFVIATGFGQVPHLCLEFEFQNSIQSHTVYTVYIHREHLSYFRLCFSFHTLSERWSCRQTSMTEANQKFTSH